MTPEEKKVFEMMRGALGELAGALPMHKSTVKTCYAINSRHRDDIHRALTAANAVSEPVGINGLTEAETSATMSVIGLSQPQVQECKDCGQSTRQDLIHTCSPQVSWPQPIETAPKDGTHLLLYFKKWGWMCGKWDSQIYHKKPKPYWTHDRIDYLGVVNTIKNQPTKWMPMPPAPEAA